MKKKKLYDYKKTRTYFNKGHSIVRKDWVLVKKGIPALEVQQQILELLGWGRGNFTRRAAKVLINAILDS